MCSFSKCITYISQVYSPSVNVRKPWKYFHFAVRRALAFALRFSAKLHRLGSECAPPHAYASNRQSAMKWSAITDYNIHFAEMSVVGHFKPTSKCICMIGLTVK